MLKTMKKVDRIMTFQTINLSAVRLHVYLLNYCGYLWLPRGRCRLGLKPDAKFIDITCNEICGRP